MKTKHDRWYISSTLGMILPGTGMLWTGLVLVLVNRAAGLVLPASTLVFVDEVLAKRHVDALTPLLIAVVAAALAQSGSYALLMRIVGRDGQRRIADLQCRLHEHIVRLPLACFSCQEPGAFVARIMPDLEGARNFASTGWAGVLGDMITGALAAIFMLWLSPLMTLGAVVVLSALTLMKRTERQVVLPIFRKQLRVTARVAGRLSESFADIRDVKAYGAEEVALFSEGMDAVVQTSATALTASSLTAGAANMVMAGASVLMAYLAAHLAAGGTITFGVCLTFAALVVFLRGPIDRLAGFMGEFDEVLGGVERAREVLELETEDEGVERTVGAGVVA